MAMFCSVAGRCGVPVDRRRHRLPAAARCCASRASIRSSRRCSTSGRARRGCRRGKRSSSAITEPKRKVTVGFVGKYVQLVEAYKSLNEALLHGGIANDCRVEIKHIDSEELEKHGHRDRSPQYDGILVAPGLRRARHRGQDRGGAVRAREARCRTSASASACRWRASSSRATCAASSKANSTEIDPATPHPVVDLMPDQRGVTDKGATMRLGAYPCVLKAGTRPPRRTARPRSASATATAGRSTTTTATRSSATAWCCRACRRTAGSSR